jgi:CRP-like cAMP-binding protein
MAGDGRFVERKVFYEGQYVFRAGDVGDRAYLVQEGCIQIQRTRPDGVVVTLGEVKKGGIFGEMALVDDQPRMACAFAKEQTTVIIVGRDQFQAKLDKTDPFIRALLKIFVRNIRAITDRSF